MGQFWVCCCNDAAVSPLHGPLFLRVCWCLSRAESRGCRCTPEAAQLFSKWLNPALPESSPSLSGQRLPLLRVCKRERKALEPGHHLWAAPLGCCLKALH